MPSGAASLRKGVTRTNESGVDLVNGQVKEEMEDDETFLRCWVEQRVHFCEDPTKLEYVLGEAGSYGGLGFSEGS